MNMALSNTAPTFVASEGYVSIPYGTGGKFVRTVTDLSGNTFGLVIDVYRASKPAIVKLDSYGIVDTSFGQNGWLILPDTSPTDMVLTNNGRLLVATVDNATGGILAYGLDGAADNTFGNAGSVNLGHNTYGELNLELAPDNNVIAFTRSQSNGISLTKLDEKGAFVLGFGQGGVAEILPQSGSALYIASEATVAPDGSVYVGGYFFTGPDSNWAVAKVSPNGELVPTFGSGGVLQAEIGVPGSSYDYIDEIAILSDSKLLIIGRSSGHLVFARIDPSGVFDQTFGQAGKVVQPLSYDVATGIVGADGSIFVGGSLNGQFAVWKFDSSGVLATNFGSSGVSLPYVGPLTYWNGGSKAAEMHLASDGSLYVNGNVLSSAYLVRYDTNGAVDILFGMPSQTLAGSVIIPENQWVTLDKSVHVFDAELATQNNYAGATLTIKRQGGANIDDEFMSTSGGDMSVLLQGAFLSVSGFTVARVIQNGSGQLSLLFNANATAYHIGRVMGQIDFRNTSDNPPANITLDWTFSDGNIGVQGVGGSLTVTQGMVVNITPINDPVVAKIGMLPGMANAFTGSSYSYDLPQGAFFDPDGPTLRFSLKMVDGTGVPPWLSVDSVTGRIQGTPDPLDIGSIFLQLEASDGQHVAYIIFALNVLPPINGTASADVLTGTASDDQISGLAGNDTLRGDAGNDLIAGGAGVDLATYSTNFAQAQVTRNADKSLTITTSIDGTDTVTGVEQVRFSDGLYSFTFLNPSPAVIANFNAASGWSSQDQFPRHVADMNGDKYADVVGFGFAGTFVSYGSAAGTFSGATLVLSNFGQTAGWASDNQFHREVVDVNGDGRADVVGFGQAGTLVSLARSDGSFADPILGVANFGVSQGWTTQDGFARTLGDVNGDGFVDIVGFGFAGTLVSLGNGNGTFQQVKTGIANFGVSQGWSSDNTYHRAVADVTGDGRDDIIGFGIAGTFVAVSKGDGTFDPAQLVLNNFGANQGWSSDDKFSRLLADVNGDDVADIVGFGIAGTLISFGKGDGTFSDASFDLANFGANQGWNSDNAYHRTIADMNNDGLADIVGFGIAGVLVGLNDGTILL